MLVRVAHHADVAVLARQLLAQHVLDGVGVLELVHQQVVVAVLVPGQHHGMRVEQLNYLHQQVVEVQRLALGEQLLVSRVHPRHHLVEIGVFYIILRRVEMALGLGDGGEEHAGRGAFGVDVQLQQGAPGEPHLVVVVVYHEPVIDADVIAVSPEDAGAYRVERAHGQLSHRVAQQGVEALLHLPRRLVGECDRHYVVRAHPPGLDQVSHSMGDDPRLAAAGAGEDQERPLYGFHRFPLRRVQPLKDVHT